jgi:hypothetical protein
MESQVRKIDSMIRRALQEEVYAGSGLTRVKRGAEENYSELSFLCLQAALAPELNLSFKTRIEKLKEGQEQIMAIIGCQT